MKLEDQLIDTLNRLAKSKKGRANVWVDGQEGKIYIRLTSRRFPGSDNLAPSLDLSSVEIDEEFQNKGVFRSLLAKSELWAQENGRTVFIENVLNPDLSAALQRYGYQSPPHQDHLTPCFFKPFSAPVFAPKSPKC